jgi:hypothetical protein
MIMSYDRKWLGLLAPLPADVGQCTRRVLHDAPFEDWVEVRVVLNDDTGGLRIVTAMFDQDDLPGSVSDLVSNDIGKRQETVSGRVESDGKIEGTYWLTERDRNTPRPLTEKERQGLREVAASLRLRYR